MGFLDRYRRDVKVAYYMSIKKSSEKAIEGYEDIIKRTIDNKEKGIFTEKYANKELINTRKLKEERQEYLEEVYQKLIELGAMDKDTGEIVIDDEDN